MSYTYNWDKDRYEDSEGNEVEWQTVYNDIKDGDPEKKKSNKSPINDIKKSINDIESISLILHY